jgi:hypothetical protein
MPSLATLIIFSFSPAQEAAGRWFEDNDPLGVAFEYPVQE